MGKFYGILTSQSNPVDWNIYHHQLYITLNGGELLSSFSSKMAWIWVAVSTILFLFVSILHKLLVMKTKNFPPGPNAIPILGHLHLLGKNPHHDLCRLARKHGPIMGMRLGFVPAVVVSSPAAAELFLKTHDLVFCSRPRTEAVHYMGYGQRDQIFAPYGPYWRDMRKLITLELLSSSKIGQFQAMRRDELGLLVESLRQSATGRESVDLSERIMGLSRDMNCLMIFGKKFGDRDLDEMGFKAVIMETVALIAKFNVADYFPYVGVLDLQGMSGKMKRLSKIFDGFLEKIIDDHVQDKRADQEQAEDFVDTMMRLMESGEASYKFDRGHVKAVLLDMLIAGMDTAAAAVEWTMSELLQHPQVMIKLQQELKNEVGMNQMVDESHLDKLNYLDCVVKETQRLHPVAPLLLPHESMEDCIVEGFYIPRKSRIIVNVWAIGRDPNVWKNPEMFSPERFIGSHIDLRGRDFELIPFGSGRRGCPGLQLGLTVVRLMVAQLVHCFNWELPDGINFKDLDMSEHFGAVTSRKNHLVAFPIYRLAKI